MLQVHSTIVAFVTPTAAEPGAESTAEAWTAARRSNRTYVVHDADPLADIEHVVPDADHRPRR